MKLNACLLALLIPTWRHTPKENHYGSAGPCRPARLAGKSGSADLRVVVTRREGLLGVIYSKRLYNCEKHTVNLVGTGSTLEIMEQAHAVRGMAPIIQDSTDDYIGSEACS